MKNNAEARGNAAPGEGQLTFGLDIGIASVGWAVLSRSRIVDLGVRAFDAAETADKGESLNLARRSARLLRRRLWRRAWRLTKLGRLLKREGLIDSAGLFKGQPSFTDSTWLLRVRGLDQRLAPKEWARVLYHLCKHRGFHWVSKAEERQADDGKGEAGKVKAGLKHTRSLMEQKNYRSAAEMVLAEFPQAQRNKQGDYGRALSRVLLDEELARLFQAQREFGNPHATAQLEAAIRGTGDRRSGLFWEQRPMQSVLAMLGHCTFEPGEYRAPKASFTAERHVWLTRLNNLRVNDNGTIRPLNDAERAVALPLPYAGPEKFTYRHLRVAFVKSGLLPESFRFNGLAYPSEKQAEEKEKNPEEQALVRLSAWHALRQTLTKAGLSGAWQRLGTDALDGRPEALDELARVLSVYKDDRDIGEQLTALQLPGGPQLVDALAGLRFDRFHALSIKALRRIVPLMEGGLRYDEAVARIPEYGHHSQRFVVGRGTAGLLPPFYTGKDARGSMRLRQELDLPRNPVVLRSLNQARKVVNALVKEYGTPWAVHIEMARDLSRALDERREIGRLQEEYKARNEAAREHFAELFERRPSGLEFEKWLLYREQDGKCAYSLAALDIERVVNDPTYVQVDHALPYSRSYDDSKNNKVLVLARENQNKGNRTPYEYLDGTVDSERWRSFAAWVAGNKNYRQAKRNRLLRKNFGREEAGGFRDRNLNDTRYICRFFKNYVEQHLQLAEETDARRCVVLNGQLTSFLRARWSLLKVRDESDRHHAMDAAVVAACSHAMVKRLADHARLKELEFLREGFPDPETGEILNPQAHQRLAERFPEPWPHFREELHQRLKCDDASALRDSLSRLGTYPAEALNGLRPLFVSRAPQRRGQGPVHEDTIRSARLLHAGKSVVSVPLQRLKPADLERMVGADDPRNRAFIDALASRLKAHGGDARKAFAEPFYKPTSSAAKQGPQVRAVKLATTQGGGMRVRGGIADLGPMLHVKVFKAGRKFLVEPEYAADAEVQLNRRELPKDAMFLFSLSKNDYVKVTFGDACHTGYFVMYETDGRLTLRAHDQPRPDKNYFRRSVASARSIERFEVDVLGRLYPTRAPSHGLA